LAYTEQEEDKLAAKQVQRSSLPFSKRQVGSMAVGKNVLQCGHLSGHSLKVMARRATIL